MWARWAAYQCTRAEDSDTASGRIQRTAIDYVIRTFDTRDRVEDAYLAGRDPIQLLASLCGESWLFHQLCTFELGGLRAFVDELATERMAREVRLGAGAGRHPEGGYESPASVGGSLLVRDLSNDRDLTLLDLGAAAHSDAGGWLMGRVVASGTTPRLMFDTRPIAVDERTAVAVAMSRARGDWVTAVKSALGDGGFIARSSRQRISSWQPMCLASPCWRSLLPRPRWPAPWTRWPAVGTSRSRRLPHTEPGGRGHVRTQHDGAVRHGGGAESAWPCRGAATTGGNGSVRHVAALGQPRPETGERSVGPVGTARRSGLSSCPRARPPRLRCSAELASYA